MRQLLGTVLGKVLAGYELPNLSAVQRLLRAGAMLLLELQEPPHGTELHGVHLSSPSLMGTQPISLRASFTAMTAAKKGMLIYTLESVFFILRDQHKIITESAYLGRDRLKDLLLTLRLVQDHTKIVLSLSHLMSPFLLLYCSW